MSLEEDRELERRIERARREAWFELQPLLKRRSPEQVARMERDAGLHSADMWDAYGPSRGCLTFSHESFVGPTDRNDVCGPLLVVGGDSPEESLLNAQRIAWLLNRFGLENHAVPDGLAKGR